MLGLVGTRLGYAGGVDTETAYMKDRQPSPGTLLGMPDYMKVRQSLPLVHVPLFEYQRADMVAMRVIPCMPYSSS